MPAQSGSIQGGCGRLVSARHVESNQQPFDEDVSFACNWRQLIYIIAITVALQRRVLEFILNTGANTVISISDKSIATSDGQDIVVTNAEMSEWETRQQTVDHQHFVSLQPCIICGARPERAPHPWSMMVMTPRGEKKVFSLPLCGRHRRAFASARNKLAWWNKTMIDPFLADEKHREISQKMSDHLRMIGSEIKREKFLQTTPPLPPLRAVAISGYTLLFYTWILGYDL